MKSPDNHSILRGAWKQTAVAFGVLALHPFTATRSLAAEGGSNLPQLDPATFQPQLIWLFITFLALYLIMWRSALPKIGSILEERANRKADDLDAADRARKKSESLEAAYQEILLEARAGAAKMLREARQELNAEIEARKVELAGKFSKRMIQAEGTVAQAKEKAMKDLEAIAAEACQAIVVKLSGRSFTRKDALSAVRTSAKAIG